MNMPWHLGKRLKHEVMGENIQKLIVHEKAYVSFFSLKEKLPRTSREGGGEGGGGGGGGGCRSCFYNQKFKKNKKHK
jgi:hypothetical protein